jgi:hypothetical protein
VGDGDGPYGGCHQREGVNPHIPDTIWLKIVVVRIHQESINGQMDEEPVTDSVGNRGSSRSRVGEFGGRRAVPGPI